MDGLSPDDRPLLVSFALLIPFLPFSLPTLSLLVSTWISLLALDLFLSSSVSLDLLLS